MARQTATNGRRAPNGSKPVHGNGKAGHRGTPPNVGGRPLVPVDWEVFDALCGVQCTLAEIAGHFECSEDTIERAVKRERGKGFAEYYREKAGRGAIAIRRKQYQVAMNGNVTMLIWLGKQRLGQTDKHISEVVGKDGEALPPQQIHVHLSDNGRGISPPSRIGNGNGTR